MIGALLRQIVGEKPWFKSMTLIGVVLLAATQAGAEAAVEIGVLSPVIGMQIQDWGTKISAVLVTLGLRKAAQG